jgi:hypothetical protein
MDKKYKGWPPTDCIEMNKREHMAEDFYNRVISPNETTFYCSDKDCFYDVYFGDTDEVKERIFLNYDYVVKEEELFIPLWKLLDRLYKTKTNLLKG